MSEPPRKKTSGRNTKKALLDEVAVVAGSAHGTKLERPEISGPKDSLSPAGVNTTTPLQVTLGSNTYRWLTGESKLRSLVLLDMTPDVEGGAVLMDIDVVFNAIPIRLATMGGRADYYVATTGGRVVVNLNQGSIDSYSQAISIDTVYELSSERTQQATVQLTCGSLLPRGIMEESEGNKVTLRSGSKRKYACTFNGSERVLAPIATPPHGLTWIFSSTRGEKAVSDFVSGNLPLYVRLSCGRNGLDGTVECVPERVALYNADKRPLGSLTSAFMWLVLHLRGYEVLNADGVTVQFAAKLGERDE